MDPELAVLFALTFVIHLIGTLAYAVRLAGTRTGRIAVSPAPLHLPLLASRLPRVGPLACAVRLAGARTGRIAVSLALFNILILVSRASNSFQAPLLAKRVGGGPARGPP